MPKREPNFVPFSVPTQSNQNPDLGQNSIVCLPTPSSDEVASNMPLVCVVRSEMEAFCQWTKGRLPTEAELIGASQTFEAPPPNQWSCSNTIMCGSVSQPQAVCQVFNSQLSPICDIAGNVTEMSSTPSGVTRKPWRNCNGDFRLNTTYAQICYDGGDVPVPHIGGRCIRDQ